MYNHQELVSCQFDDLLKWREVYQEIYFTFEFDESDPELALVIWLNQILGKARELGMVFGHFRITRQGNHWHGTVLGEKWRDGLERGVEVKGATLTMLSVKQIDTQ